MPKKAQMLVRQRMTTDPRSILIVRGGTIPVRKRGEPTDNDKRLANAVTAIMPDAHDAGSQTGFDVALEAMADATKAAIAADLMCWSFWCLDTGRPPLPATPEGIVAYLRWLEQEGRKPATLERRLASLAKAHELAGYEAPGPVRHLMVRNALKAARKRCTMVQRQAAPLRFGGALRTVSGFSVSALLGACAGDLQGLRDAALLSLGFDGGLRVSELVAVKWADIEPQLDDSALLHLPRSKTDQTGKGAYVWLSPETLRLVRRWIAESGISDGPLFRRVAIIRRKARAAVAPVAYDQLPGNIIWDRAAIAQRLKGTPATAAQTSYAIGEAPLSRQGVCGIIRRVALAALDAGLVDMPVGEQFEAVQALSTHSLRVGLTQDLFADEREIGLITQTLRWSSPVTALRYGRKIMASDNAAAQMLGTIRR